MLKSFVILKPIALQRNIVGKIITRFEDKGLILKYLKMEKPKKEIVEEHYKDIKKYDFFPDIVNGMMESSIIIMVLEGDDCINQVRKMIGSTDPLKADLGTIRGDFGLDINKNIIHASDSIDNYNREIELWLNDDKFEFFE